MDVNLAYGSRTIKVHVVLGQRKRLSITVHPDCSVIAKAPEDSSAEKIESRIKSRAKWIAQQLAFFERHQPTPPPRQYVNGETHYYLGRQYRLRICAGETSRLRLIGRYFEMELPNPRDRSKAKELMQEWHKVHSRQILESRIAIYLPHFRSRGALEPRIRYRRMKKRWGSCSRTGVIMVNTELTKAPLHCVDYVVAHELCHLLHPRHDRGFFRLLGQVLPDWEKRKERLERAFL